MIRLHLNYRLAKGLLAVGLLATVLVLTACGSGTTPPPTTTIPPTTSPPTTTTPTPTAPPIEVVIEGFAFPAMLNIPVGTTVVWYNNDSDPHTVTALDNSFDGDRLFRDDEFSYTFEQKGIFEYYCTIHPYMKGTVVVGIPGYFDGAGISIIDPLLAIRLLFVLGIINLVSGVLIFFSCRCLAGSKLGMKLMKYQAYQRFYKYHCYIWMVFWSSVMIHAALAIILFGWPG